MPSKPVPSKSSDDGSGVGLSVTVTKSPVPLLIVALKQAPLLVSQTLTLTFAVIRVTPESPSVSPMSLPVPNVAERIHDEPDAKRPHPLDSDKKPTLSELSPD